MRVLQILIGNLDQGGLENNLIELYKNIDREKVQFDFIVHKEENYYNSLVKKMGGKIYVVPYKSKNPFGYVKKFKELLKNNDYYHIVHIHTSYSIVLFDAMLCKKMGINNIIFHGHASESNRLKQKILNKLLRSFIPKYSSLNLAVSDSAARWLYPKNVWKKKNITILNNSIDIEKFKFDFSLRSRFRKKLSIDDDTIVLGTTGRLDSIKNHTFLLEVLEKIVQKGLNYKLIIIGEGPQKEFLEKKIDEKYLNNYAILLGKRDNINELLNVFDIFLFPSLYEGLGLSVVEAEINGLPCIINETLPTELNISKSVIRKPIDQGCDIWVQEILSQKQSREYINLNDFIKFSNKSNAKILEKIYEGFDKSE